MLNKLLHRNKHAKWNWNKKSKKSSSWPTYNNKLMVKLWTSLLLPRQVGPKQWCFGRRGPTVLKFGWVGPIIMVIWMNGAHCFIFQMREPSAFIFWMNKDHFYDGWARCLMSDAHCYRNLKWCHRYGVRVGGLIATVFWMSRPHCPLIYYVI